MMPIIWRTYLFLHVPYIIYLLHYFPFLCHVHLFLWFFLINVVISPCLFASLWKQEGLLCNCIMEAASCLLVDPFHNAWVGYTNLSPITGGAEMTETEMTVRKQLILHDAAAYLKSHYGSLCHLFIYLWFGQIQSSLNMVTFLFFFLFQQFSWVKISLIHFLFLFLLYFPKRVCFFNKF